MSFYGNVDFAARVALGLVPGWATVNKFGEAPDCDSGVATDLWDGADGATSTDVWVAPTQARLHAITSASGNDDGDPVGTGLRTLRVYGLTDWDTAEVNEDIIMNGVSNVNTTNSYVIIHRMEGLTFGSGGTNAGIITATAATDGTITAAIQASNGQTEMAIYGVPSTQKFVLQSLSVTLLRGSGASAAADGTLLVKLNADQADAGFVNKGDFLATHDSNFIEIYPSPDAYAGPCLIKMQVKTDTANAQVTGSFDGFLVNN